MVDKIGWKKSLNRACRCGFRNTDITPHALGRYEGRALFNRVPIGEVCPADIQCELQSVSDWSFDSDRGVCLGRHAKGVFVLTSDLLVVLSFVPEAA